MRTGGVLLQEEFGLLKSIHLLKTAFELFELHIYIRWSINQSVFLMLIDEKRRLLLLTEAQNDHVVTTDLETSSDTVTFFK